MEGLFAVLVGALAVAAAPLVPVVRPVAKAAVAGGLALTEAATAVAAASVAVIGQQLEHFRGNSGADATVGPVEQAGDAVAAAAADVEATVSETTADAGAAVAATATAVEEAAAETAAHTEAAVAATATAVEEAAAETISASETAAGGAETTGDDLTLINGIGPKVAGILNAAGITTYAQLAATSDEALRTILEAAGPRFRAMNPTSWPEQAGHLSASV